MHRVSLIGFDRPLGVSGLTTALPELRDEAVDGAEATASLPSKPVSRPPAPAGERPSREEFVRVFEGQGRSVRATAKHFGRERRQIYRWLEAYGIQRNAEDE